ncbi:hypothetical protein [Chitinophaga sp. 212800010-3]|uniref:hypothetical protein n=1 Tax=unclassified Chitinophaga TaxID=2619133 RepID=UPI002DEB68E0|nr:hypothetical protein [Chitinophaga sp. 212800010-3]
MKNTKRHVYWSIGLITSAIAFSCKKNETPLLQKSNAEASASIDSIRAFIANKNEVRQGDVGYDYRNNYFSIYQINTISYKDALADFLKNKTTTNEKH